MFYTRKIRAVTGNGTGAIIINSTPDKRVLNFQLDMTYAGGTNTLAALMTALTEIRVKVGTSVKWRLSGTKLRDWCLLRGTTFDFNGVPNTGCQVTIPLAPEWFMAVIQDALAWNPKLLGGAISLEITSSANLTITAYETIADNLDAQFAGILTLETIRPVAGGTEFFTGKEFEPRGRLVSASIYPDSGASNEITPASLYLGGDNVPAHEELTSAQNDEQLERKGLTPAASGRTANVYDIVPVKDDQLTRGYNLAAWGSARFKIGAGAAMSGTSDILICRLESGPN